MPTTTDAAAAEAIDVALDLMRAATSSKTQERVHKTDRDFATQADFDIEDAVRELLGNMPGFGFLGEERGHTGNRDRYWCFDPIDGTTNFVRGLPNYGLALSLIEDGQPVAGHIALPAHDERYLVHAGKALLNNEPVHTAPTTALDDAIVSVGDFATGAHSRARNDRRLSDLSLLANTVSRVRMLGSAATDLAWLAAGRLDAVVIHANHPWDVTAGIAIARAAGAEVTHLDGSPYSLQGPDVLAAAPGVHAELVALLAHTV